METPPGFAVQPGCGIDGKITAMIHVSLFVGGISPLPESRRPTGMFKQPVSAPLHLETCGFVGDEQADRSVHGGPDKALHLYPAVHYARLTAVFPQAAGQLRPGSLGENISSPALDESQVRIGEIFRLGTARLQVCQPRSPCWKIDERFGVSGMAAFIAEQGLTGWYFRVLQPGLVAPGDALAAVAAAETAPTLANAMQPWQAHRPDPRTLRELAATPGIAANWQKKIVDRADWLENRIGQPAPPAATFLTKPDN